MSTDVGDNLFNADRVDCVCCWQTLPSAIVTYHNSCSGINAMQCDASHSAQMFLRPGYALPGMCLAWILIIFHEMRMDRLATANVQQAINKVGGIRHGDLRSMIAAEKGRIAASKTFRQRMLSIKVLAGF